MVLILKVTHWIAQTGSIAGRAKRRHTRPRPGWGGIAIGPSIESAGFLAADSSGITATGSPPAVADAHLEFAAGSARIASADRPGILADLEIEGSWPTAARSVARREVHVGPDPAWIDNVHVEERALALERRVVLETQHQIACALG
jgi:hypothetical protein